MKNEFELGEWTAAPSFGREDGVIYRPRPGSYGIVLRDHALVACIKTPTGLYLPGGGAEEAEEPGQTLMREFQEELGRAVFVKEFIGRAIDFIIVSDEGNFAKMSSFYAVDFADSRVAALETEGCLEWVAVPEAIERLKFASQRWAMQKIAGKPVGRNA